MTHFRQLFLFCCCYSATTEPPNSEQDRSPAWTVPPPLPRLSPLSRIGVHIEDGSEAGPGLPVRCGGEGGGRWKPKLWRRRKARAPPAKRTSRGPGSDALPSTKTPRKNRDAGRSAAGGSGPGPPKTREPLQQTQAVHDVTVQRSASSCSTATSKAVTAGALERVKASSPTGSESGARPVHRVTTRWLLTQASQ